MAISGIMKYKATYARNEENGTSTILIKPEYAEFRDAMRTMSYGKERRALIMKFINSGGEFYVNRSHTPQTKKDKDIEYLIKHNKVQLVNEHYTWGKYSFITKKA